MSTEARWVPGPTDVARAASRLAEAASIEIGSVDFEDFSRGRQHMRPGQRVYVSHLPGQTWKRTFEMCARISGAGLDPVPHVPVRLIRDEPDLRRILGAAIDAGVREPLLISGDYPKPLGAFSAVAEVLATGALQARGFTRVSLAGHPEGHPRVPWDVICEAQVEKWRLAQGGGLQVTFVTQFFFAIDPFVHWARFLRASGVEARLVAGVAGPAGLGRLIKLAARCGVGASVRALTSRPASFVKLLDDHAAEPLLLDLGVEMLHQPGLFDGLHVFSLGGFLRTAAWLRDYHP
jgi:methylenetetrahydrofolate reductase (NADPH)